MARVVRWFFPSVMAVTLVLILLVLVRPAARDLIDPLGSLILVLVTLTYAWFSYFVVQEMQAGNRINMQTIEEMREQRKQAATPMIRAEFGMSSGPATHFFKVSNVGNSPAINLEILLRPLPARPGVTEAMPVFRRVALLPLGGEFQVEADLGSFVDSHVESYGIVATYSNVLGEDLEDVTEFPRGRPGVLPGSPTEFRPARSRSSL